MKINLDDFFGESSNSKPTKQTSPNMNTRAAEETISQYSLTPSDQEFNMRMNLNEKIIFARDPQRDETRTNLNSEFENEQSFRSMTSDREKMPGERLYYEDKANKVRKMYLLMLCRK